MDKILYSWNDPLASIDLMIYTILSLEKLFEYYKYYRTEFFKEITMSENYYVALSNNNNNYDLPQYLITDDFKKNHNKDFGFTPLSSIYTDTLFEDKTKKNDELELMTLINDKYFLHIKNLRKALNEDGISHYVSIDLTRPFDTKPTQFLIGGLNKKLEPIINNENYNLYFRHLFTMDEWFFKPERKSSF
jgi:hypothetical protein